MIFNDGTPNAYDIWMLPLHGQPRPVLATPASEFGGQLSPDGRWLAYHSDESGRLEVYVRPFPRVSEGKWTISTAGGQRPLWSSDGTELFYAADSAIMRVGPMPAGVDSPPRRRSCCSRARSTRRTRAMPSRRIAPASSWSKSIPMLGRRS